MGTADQYTKDSARLSALVERYTGIPKERVFHFVMENAAAELLPCANMICDSDAQREKLAALFEFKNLYEAVKGAEKGRSHRLDSPLAAAGYFRSLFADVSDRERLLAAFMDNKNRVIATKTMFTGTVNEAAVWPREVIKEALFYNATSIMLAHNHPGGSGSPSQPDIELTEQIRQGVEAVGVKLLDHIIIAGDEAVSLVELGHIHTDGLHGTFLSAAAARERGGSYQAEKPGIRQTLAANRARLESGRAASPQRAAAKTKSNNMEV